VEKFCVKESNRYERDFIKKLNLGPKVGPNRGGAKAKSKGDKYKKFPKATKNLLKGWLWDHQQRPYHGRGRRRRGGENELFLIIWKVSKRQGKGLPLRNHGPHTVCAWGGKEGVREMEGMEGWRGREGRDAGRGRESEGE
jgi:hypothetical protein